MNTDDVVTLIAALREEGSDTTSVEAKTSTGGFPTDLARTISAFANTPGGGTIILGLDEHDGFAARDVYDAVEAQKRLASTARRSLDPPVQLEVSAHDIEGSRVVVAEVFESSASLKPSRVTVNNKAYLRAYDGDYAMSELEEQAFIANRDHPRFDRRSVQGASVADLDKGLLAIYRETCRGSSSRLNQFSDDEILLRTGVLDAEGSPTLAGLIALGIYPQQFAPNLVIQASVAVRPGDPQGTRASDARKFDGPLPVMLDEAARWVQRNTRTRVRFGNDGHGRDEPEYPAAAVRELIANALVHRDLGPHAMSSPISLVLEHNQLIIINPGGLWGITVDRLGRERISSARNDSLQRIAQNVRSIDGRRVVEALASGIPTILDSLEDAGMVPPAFHDQGIRFTVRVPNHALLAAEDLSWLATVTRDHKLSDTQRHALVAMRHGRHWTNSTFRVEFPRDSTVARADLQGLVDLGFTVAQGERGGRTYSLAPTFGAATFGEDDLFAGLLESAIPRAVQAEAPRPAVGREANATTVLAALAHGPRTLAELAAASGLTRRRVTYALSLLRGRGQAVLDGRQGVRNSVYRLPHPADPHPADEPDAPR